MSSKVELELLARTEKAIAELRKAQGAIEGVGDATKQPEKQFGGFADTVSGALLGINQGLALAQTAANGFKKAFDFAEEGAQIEFTATKFDRLARSVGTTSDALMGDLKEATGGLMSEMELTAAATDFLTLGLAKSHDEAVRLTNVAGQLGMNMNQLVLTLTNQTTMRFDALGIAVDGFDEKVEALKATGMDANDAFNEAFLQQAEEQIEKVGSVAESSAASFMKFRAATEDLTAAWKKSAVRAGGFIDLLADGQIESAKYADVNSRLNEALNTGLITQEEYNRVMAEGGATRNFAGAATDLLTDREGRLALATANAIGGIEEQTAITYEFSDALQEAADNEMAHYMKVADQGAEIDQRWADAAGEAAIAHQTLAQSLMGADDQQFGQLAIDKLYELKDAGVMSGEEVALAMEAVGLEFGNVDTAALQTEQNFSAVYAALESGDLADWNLPEALRLAKEEGVNFMDAVETRWPGVFTSAAISVEENAGKMTTEFAKVAEQTSSFKGDLEGIDGKTYEATVVINTIGSAPMMGTPAGVSVGGASDRTQYLGGGRAAGGPVFSGQSYLVG